MQQSPAWEANIFSGSQEIPRILWNPTAHYRTDKCPPPVPNLSQIDAAHTRHCTSWRSILILSSHLRLCLPGGLFPSDFPTKSCTQLSPPPHVLHAPPISLFSIWSPDHSNEMYRPLSSSLCNFLHHNIVSPLLGPNKFVPKYSHCSTLSNKLHPIFILCVGPAFWSPDMTCT